MTQEWIENGGTLATIGLFYAKDIDCKNLHDLTREPVGPGFFLFYNLTAKRVFYLVKFYRDQEHHDLNFLFFQ